MYGLLRKENQKEREGNGVPLKNVVVCAFLVDSTAEVHVNQMYYNNCDYPIEAVYKFPLDPLSAIYKFEAVIDGRVIVGVVRGKEEAAQVYDDAISSGKTALLMEQTTSELFCVSVGNLPPHKEVTIKIGYVVELTACNDDSFRFFLPTTIFPATTAATTAIAEEISNTGYTAAYTMQVTVNIKMPSSVVSVKSTSHPALLLLAGVQSMVAGPNETISFVCENVVMDKDFEILVQLVDSHTPRLFIEQQEGPDDNVDVGVANKTEIHSCAVMLNIWPNLLTHSESSSEIIFLIDQSGSMQGSAINRARETMYSALKHLPASSTFNIYGFGSDFVKNFPKSVKYNHENLYKARQALANLDATLGGTNLLPPLQDILDTGKYPETSMQIFLFTDGGVSNPNDVIHFVQNNTKNTRIFTFGIGDQVDRTLVEKIAAAANGVAVFIEEYDTQLEPKVVAQINRAIEPAYENVNVAITLTNGEIIQNSSDFREKSNPTQEISKKTGNYIAPMKLGPIFNNQMYTVYGLIKDSTSQVDSVTLTATGKAGEFSCTIRSADATHIKDHLTIHRFAARCLIRELEESGESIFGKQDQQCEVVKFAKLYNLASSYTSFVGVDTEANTPVGNTMMSKPVPLPTRQPTTHTQTQTQTHVASGRRFAMPMLTGAIAWREAAVKYRKNELFVDFIEKIELLVSSTTTVLQFLVNGSVEVKPMLSGMPDCRFDFNKVMWEEDTDLKYHPCVRIPHNINNSGSGGSDNSRLSFIPPNSSFTLLSYSRYLERKLPISVVAIVERTRYSHVNYSIQLKTQFGELAGRRASTIKLHIPVLPDVSLPVFQFSAGKATYMATNNSLLWELKDIENGHDLWLKAKFSLPSVEAEEKYKMGPVMVDCEISNFNAFGLSLKSAKIVEQSGYTVTTFVKSTCICHGEFRPTEFVK